MLSTIVLGASIQDRNGAPGTIASAMQGFSTLVKLFADGAYAGNKLEKSLAPAGPIIEIVKRPEGAKSLVVIARRWVVERTFTWLDRCRRLARDWEASIASSEVWIFISSIRRMTQRIARAEFCVGHDDPLRFNLIKETADRILSSYVSYYLTSRVKLGHADYNNRELLIATLRH